MQYLFSYQDAYFSIHAHRTMCKILPHLLLEAVLHLVLGVIAAAAAAHVKRGHRDPF